MHRLVGILGMAVMMGLAFLFSTNRRAIRVKTVAWGLGLQIVFAFLVMRWEYGRLLFQKAGAGAPKITCGVCAPSCGRLLLMMAHWQ